MALRRYEPLAPWFYLEFAASKRGSRIFERKSPVIFIAALLDKSGCSIIFCFTICITPNLRCPNSLPWMDHRWSRKCWRAVSKLLGRVPEHERSSNVIDCGPIADDFAELFTSKVAGVWASTASALPSFF